MPTRIHGWKTAPDGAGYKRRSLKRSGAERPLVPASDGTGARFRRTKRKALLLRAVLCIPAFVFLRCSRDANPIAVQPPYPLAAAQGMDGHLLTEAVHQAGAISGMKSLLVARNGVLVVETYFHGHGPDSLHDVRSVTKSVVSILIGIAVDRGFIPSINQPVGACLDKPDETLDSAKAAITIEHLLTMSAGHRANANWTDTITRIVENILPAAN